MLVEHSDGLGELLFVGALTVALKNVAFKVVGVAEESLRADALPPFPLPPLFPRPLLRPLPPRRPRALPPLPGVWLPVALSCAGEQVMSFSFPLMLLV